MERIEEIRNRVNTCEDDPCISLEEAELLLSLIETHKKEIEELRHYKNLYNELFKGFQNDGLRDPKEIT